MMKDYYLKLMNLFTLKTLLFLTILSTSFNTKAQFAKGADVSWISEMEASGYVWNNDNGNQQDLLGILQDHGMNAARLRVWVNPADGWSDLNDMVTNAIRIKKSGMDIMLTIHYSDVWADPANQTKPSAWTNLSDQELMDQVWTYTQEVITTLANNGVTPKWVQIGNETNDGMLWDNGKASVNMQTYAWLITTGHNAIKDINSDILTIVHISNGWDNALFQWNIGGIIANGGQFDMIGMSLYVEPGNYQTLNDQCIYNIEDMISTYGKEVMICEVGMRSDEAATSKAFLSDILSRSESVGASGVFYWEPQVYNGWKGYGLGAWQEDGRPSIALDAFGGSSDSEPGSCGTCGSGIVDGGVYRITPQHAQDQALELYALGTANGTNINQWSYWGGNHQHWVAEDRGNDNWSFHPATATSKTMDVWGVSQDNGANIALYDYWGGAGQQWYFSNAGNGWVQIKSSNSDKCLDILGKSTENGANLVQWECAEGSANQTFKFESISNARLLSDIEQGDILSTVEVYAAKNTVYISNITSLTHVEVYNSSGKLTKTLDINDNTEFTLEKGLWIISIQSIDGHKITKLLTE
ncbi:MAG: glycosyl hydrolase 53 family protein [Reichenbachiella sp.]